MAFDFANRATADRVEQHLAKVFRRAGFTVRDPGPTGGNLVAYADSAAIGDVDLTLLVQEILDVFRDAE